MESTETATSTTSNGSAGLLEGIRGRLGFELDGRTVAVLEVQDGHIAIVEDGEPANARVIWKREDDIKKFLGGELNVVVAALQGRLVLDGDALFAIKVLHGLRAAPPLAARPSEGG